MRRLPLVALALLAAGATWPDPAALSPSQAPAASALRISVQHPAAGARFADERPVMLSGFALPPGVSGPRRDVVVVIDVSESTLDPVAGPESLESGVWPVVAPVHGAPPGSILEAEISAARRLLRSLDPQLTRVAIVSFSGEPVSWDSEPVVLDGLHPDARTWTGLTGDWSAVERALDALEAAGASGLTHMAAGVERATAELVGGPEAVSAPDPVAQRVVLFMTDGVPTLPVPGDAWRNQAELFKQARRAASYGIRIHSFAVGNEALRGPFTVETLATETGGSFTPVRDPATLPQKLPAARFGEVASLRVRNATTAEDALATTLRADGSWDALIRLAPGQNQIEIEATTSDGTRGVHQLVLARDAAASAQAIPEHLVPRRRELLEQALEERREAHRQALVEEMERERAQDGGGESADARAERQRRELELELERTPGAVGAPVPELR
jgi:hypothetical protein